MSTERCTSKLLVWSVNREERESQSNGLITDIHSFKIRAEIKNRFLIYVFGGNISLSPGEFVFHWTNYAAAEVGRTKSDKASAMSDGGGQMAYLHAITSGK